MIKTKAEIKNILDSARYSVASLERTFNEEKQVLNRIKYHKQEIAQAKVKAEFVDKSEKHYKAAMDVIYQESVGVLIDKLNGALNYVMDDRPYAMELDIGDSRNSKTLKMYLVNLEAGTRRNLKNSVGNSARTIISFILKTYYLINKNSRVLFLDEKYSAVSAEYVPKFFELVSGLAKDKKLIIVLITHDERFSPFGDKVFKVHDGYITIVSNKLLTIKEEESLKTEAAKFMKKRKPKK